MPTSNADIAEAFREMADLLEISSANSVRWGADHTSTGTVQHENPAVGAGRGVGTKKPW